LSTPGWYDVDDSDLLTCDIAERCKWSHHDVNEVPQLVTSVYIAVTSYRK